MIPPDRKYRDAGASPALATEIAKGEQGIIERFGAAYEELREKCERLEEQVGLLCWELERARRVGRGEELPPPVAHQAQLAKRGWRAVEFVPSEKP